MPGKFISSDSLAVGTSINGVCGSTDIALDATTPVMIFGFGDVWVLGMKSLTTRRGRTAFLGGNSVIGRGKSTFGVILVSPRSIVVSWRRGETRLL